MASSSHSVNFEGIPLSSFHDAHTSSSEEELSHSVNLRRAQTDVHLRERRRQDSDKYHSYGGRERRVQYTLPSRCGGELLSSHVFHHGRECRPSAWYNTVMARRRRGEGPNNEEEAVDEIAEAMEGDERLMSDNVDGELKRREALRDLIKPLWVKKEIRRRLTARRTSRGHAKPISRLQSLKYTISMQWYKMKQTIQDTFHDYSLWHKELKKIEGTFGTGVGSYFRFLRYLFLLNLAVTIIICGFILTPQLLARVNSDEESPAGVGVTTSILLTTPMGVVTPAALRVSDFPASSNLHGVMWEPVLHESSGSSCNQSQLTSSHFGGLDWLTGAGWFDTTELYYGTYSCSSISVNGHQHYSMPKAYFLVIFVLFIFYLVVILRRVIVLYKNNDIDIEHDMSASFVRKVFSSWDFSITEKKAANIKHKSIYNELKEILQEYLSEELIEEWQQRLLGWVVKAVFWTVVLSFLGFLGWATYSMLEHDVLRNTDSSLGLLLYPLIVTCIILIFPLVFTQVVKHEGYKTPRTRLYVTLVRTILLELTVLGVLVGTWYVQATSEEEESETDNTSITSSSEDSEEETDIQERDECWETLLGQEFYRLLIMDFLIGLVMQLSTFILSHISEKTAMEFNIGRYAVHLIYNQTLLWCGLFFCPLTPIIVVIKIIIMFYIQKFILLHSMNPDNNPWRAAQAETVYLVLTLVSLILSFFGYLFILLKGKTSWGCGPFQGHENYVDYFWELIDSKEEAVLLFISWLFRPGVVAGILIVLIILVYCAKSMAEGRAEMIKVLRHQLELELRDRAFLLQLTEKVRRGDYRPGRQDSHIAASPRPQTPKEPHSLTQRASFVFTDSKVHPADSEPVIHRFSDYAGESAESLI